MCMYACICVYVSVHALCVYVHVAYTCMCVSVHECMHACLYVCVVSPRRSLSHNTPIEFHYYTDSLLPLMPYLTPEPQSSERQSQLISYYFPSYLLTEVIQLDQINIVCIPQGSQLMSLLCFCGPCLFRTYPNCRQYPTFSTFSFFIDFY